MQSSLERFDHAAAISAVVHPAAALSRSFLRRRYRPLRQIVSLSALNCFDLLFGGTKIRHVFFSYCGSARGRTWPR